jgi:hypothetical protein
VCIDPLGVQVSEWRDDASAWNMCSSILEVSFKHMEWWFIRLEDVVMEWFR